MTASLRVGFVTGIEGRLHHGAVAAKHHLQSLTSTLLPDVYSLPRFLGRRCAFIRNGERLAPGAFDLLFAELNGSTAQLEYLAALTASQPPALAVIPGPPEILESRLTARKTRLVREILSGAQYVLAYSPAIAAFHDGLIGRRRARVIPWPFDYDGLRRLERAPTGRGTIRIVLGVPLRFEGVTCNQPLLLKAGLMDALETLPHGERTRLTFHSFVYTKASEEAFAASGFAAGLPVTLEPRRPFGGFVRFIGGCDAVINLPPPSALGRVAFIAAALDKPGVFTSDAALSEALYPGSTVAPLDGAALREALAGLLAGLVAGKVPQRFMPDAAVARNAGDFDANAATFARIFADLGSRQRTKVAG